jgi:serine/threonine protein kinase
MALLGPVRGAVEPGDVVKGKYRIERVLGRGGMGMVVAAHHLKLDEPVAIKLLLPAQLADPVIVERFAREARAAAKIKSDHVARVTDVDVLDDGTPFMVMEYLEGADLETVLREREILPVPTAVDYVLEACDAIGEAHRRGIVHRDLKPANLFLAKQSGGGTRIKVLDFGISKVVDQQGVTTTSSAAAGSAPYMSPEQYLDFRNTDARTDIWALGATLYELVTGRQAFPGQSGAQVCARVMSAEPELPSTLCPEIPLGLSEAILRCLVKDRENRCGSIPELEAALAPYAGTVRPSRPSGDGPAPRRTPRRGSGIETEPILLVGRVSPSTVETLPAPERGLQAPGPAGGTTGGVTSIAPPPPKTSLRPLLLGVSVVVGLAALGAIASQYTSDSRLPIGVDGSAVVLDPPTSKADSGARPSPPPSATAAVSTSGAVSMPLATATAGAPMGTPAASASSFVRLQPTAKPSESRPPVKPKKPELDAGVPLGVETDDPSRTF